MYNTSSYYLLCFISVSSMFCLLILTQNLSKPHEYAIAPAHKNIRIQRIERKQNPSQYQDDEEQIKRRHYFIHKSPVQAERQRILRQACFKYPELSQGELSTKTKTQILVNEKQNLLYCFIPKVACSNWKRVMMKLAGKTNKHLVDITPLEAHENHGFRTLNDYTEAQQKKMLASFMKFVFVRNPFIRVLSAYKNKFENIERYRNRPAFHPFGREIIRKYRKNATTEALETGENATWTEFIKYITDPSGNLVEDHWEEMNTLCSPCQVKYDFLGRLETIETDAHFILQILNLSDPVEYPSANTSYPTNSTASYETIFRRLNAQQLERLWNIYKKDFELFGYPKPGFL